MNRYLGIEETKAEEVKEVEQTAQRVGNMAEYVLKPQLFSRSRKKASSIIPKGEVYESHIFTKKEEWFKSKAFTREVKEMFTEIINCHVKEESEKLSVF